MNIGVLGGTFDPVHNAHLIVAREVSARLVLDEVIFIPAGQPWLNKTGSISDVEHRVQMLRLAIENEPYFRLSMIEIDELPSNTVDTVSDLLAELAADDELFLIISWDTLAGLWQWWQPERLINLCRLVAVPRPGYSRPDLDALEEKIPGLTCSTIILDSPEVDISATEIRKRVAQGLSISRLVPEPVAEYIRQHQLYLAEDS